jgi:hypothetical protein
MQTQVYDALGKGWQKYMGNIKYTEDCIPWEGPRAGEYGSIMIEGIRISAHRLSYMIHFGSISDNIEVTHNCDNPICVNPNHLTLQSHQNNLKDAVTRCRASRYASRELIESIKVDHVNGLSERVIAKKYGRHRSSINRILSGRAYT